MNVTPEVQNIISKIATNRAESEQQGAVSAIQREMDAFETGGDPDLDQHNLKSPELRPESGEA